MDDYLNTPIKELITKFPKVREILEEDDIGCVPCRVGTCSFKDIIEIHNLSPQDKEEVMTRLAKQIGEGLVENKKIRGNHQRIYLIDKIRERRLASKGWERDIVDMPARGEM